MQSQTGSNPSTARLRNQTLGDRHAGRSLTAPQSPATSRRSPLLHTARTDSVLNMCHHQPPHHRQHHLHHRSLHALSAMNVSTPNFDRTTACPIQPDTASGRDTSTDPLSGPLSELMAGFSLEDRLCAARLESERCRARLHNALAQQDVLGGSLQHARDQAEHFQQLLCQYESNCSSLQLVASADDHLIAAYDCLLALLESELLLLVANCRAAGVDGVAAVSCPCRPDHPLPAALVAAVSVAAERRRSCENVARHTVSRLNEHAVASADSLPDAPADASRRTAECLSGAAARCVSGGGVSSSSSGVDCGDSCRHEEARLQEHIERLQWQRARLLHSVQALPSGGLCGNHAVPATLHKVLDIEHSITVQELMSAREDAASLRLRVFVAECERSVLSFQLSARCAAERILQAKLCVSEQQPLLRWKCPVCETELNGRDKTQPQSSQQSRIEELHDHIEKIRKSSKDQHQEAEKTIIQLSHVNRSLAEQLERTKQRYHSRMKHVEYKMINLIKTHSLKNTERGSTAAGFSSVLSSESLFSTALSPALTHPHIGEFNDHGRSAWCPSSANRRTMSQSLTSSPVTRPRSGRPGMLARRTGGFSSDNSPQNVRRFRPMCAGLRAFNVSPDRTISEKAQDVTSTVVTSRASGHA